jgi:hypothetical protein
VSVALLDPLAPPLDRLACLLLERSVERVDVATGEAEPLADGADEAVDLPSMFRSVSRAYSIVRRRSPSLTRPRGGLKVKLLGRSEKTPASPSNGI